MFPTALEVSIAIELHTISSLSRVNFRGTHPQFGVYWQLGGGEAGKIHRSLREDLETEASLNSSQRSKESLKGLTLGTSCFLSAWNSQVGIGHK